MSIDMSIFDFDSMESYKKVTDDELNNPQKINENIEQIRLDDDIELLCGGDLREIFEYNDEYDLNDERVIRLAKYDEISGVSIFDKDDLVLLRKNGKKYLTYVCEIQGIYNIDNLLTIQGWDYNIIINLDDMSYREINVR